MAAMTTALEEFSDSANSRTFNLAAHTVKKPQLCIQKRKVPSGNQVVAEDSFVAVFGSTDADGNTLPQKISISVIVRRPLDAQSADVYAARNVIRDFVAADDFAYMIDKSAYAVGG